MKKKVIFVLTLAVVMLATTATPAMARGHNGRRGTSSCCMSVCSIDDCTLSGRHMHSNRAYYGHYYGDGHDYHGICDVVDCVVTGYHEHEGLYRFGHHGGYR